MTSSRHRSFLPHGGAIWLCEAIGESVTPLAQAPGMADALWKLSEDGAEFGTIDQEGKRIAHYKMLDHAPWFEVVHSPLTLPKRARANDIVIHQGVMVVAGHSRDGEALWIRDPLNTRLWKPIHLPAELRKRGKSVDALYVDHNKLVAIDNHRIPKWILVYDLALPWNATPPEVIPLTTHTTYEQVHACAQGEDTYALYSIGINHGYAHFYISLLNKHTLKEMGKWAWDKPKAFDWPHQPIAAQHTDRPFYENIKHIKYCGNILLATAGHDGLYAARIPDFFDGNAPQHTLAAFKKISLTHLNFAARIEQSHGIKNGVYIVGRDYSEPLEFEWISHSELESQCP